MRRVQQASGGAVGKCWKAAHLRGVCASLILPCSMPQAASGVGTCLQSYNNMASFNGTGFLQICEQVVGMGFIMASNLM